MGRAADMRMQPALVRSVFAVLPALINARVPDDVPQELERLARRLEAAVCVLHEPGAQAGLCDLFGSGGDEPLRWSALRQLGAQGPVSGELAAHAAGGIRDGIACPVHGAGGCKAVLLVLFSRSVTLGPEVCDALMLLSKAAFMSLARLRRAAAGTMPVALTIREIECLGWVLEGKTNWEIGVLTGVSARTVQFHLANAARKLDACNRIQAGVRALLAGLVVPPSHAEDVWLPANGGPLPNPLVGHASAVMRGQGAAPGAVAGLSSHAAQHARS